MQMRKKQVNLGLRKLLSDLKPMTWPKRLDHLWTYYRDYLALASAFVLVAVIVITGAVNKGKQVALSGMLANADITDKGYYYLTERYRLGLGGDPDVTVSLREIQFDDLMTTKDIERDHTAAAMPIAMVEAKSLDYMIMDKTAMKLYVGYDIFLDLRQLLSEEELSHWPTSSIQNVQTEGMEAYPFALKLSDTAFGSACMEGQDDIYIAFIGNTTRPDACKAILEHILLWEQKNR